MALIRLMSACFTIFLMASSLNICVFFHPQYDTSTEAFTLSADGKIVLRRISCDIVDASYKYWKLPKLPLPLRVKGGYLDFLYLDNNMRITRGNRGGLFVHFRPEFLDEMMD